MTGPDQRPAHAVEPMVPMRIVVRVDASPDIGLGHAMRCLALIEALRAAGHAVHVVTMALPLRLADMMCETGSIVSHIAAQPGDTADAIATAALASSWASDWVIADGYHFSLAWQSQVRAATGRLALLDDEAQAASWDVDLLLNQNAGVPPTAYAGTAPGAVVLLGARYALLRTTFQRWRGWMREVPPRARHVLLTVGGSDSDNLTARLVAGLAACDGLDVRVLVGAANPHLASIEAAAAQGSAGTSFTVLEHVEDMAAQMAWADLALSGSGSTLWELAYMQVPSLLLVLADNQRGGARAGVAAGMARLLGDGRAIDPTHVGRAVTSLADDAAARAAMALAGGRLVDGEGAHRVVQALVTYAH
jgi:UDP-2,4-diacetamido-2,4,6-trideoxy-beta-L-altropyranose hydrolase